MFLFFFFFFSSRRRHTRCYRDWSSDVCSSDLLEVHARTGFLGEFTHASGGEARMDDLEISMAGVLVAEACNVGFRPVAKPGVAALTRARLSHVEQNYLRADTLRAANARLINAQTELPLAQLWGGGLVASVDGLRFVVPVRTVYAAHNPRYFGRRRGSTWLNAINDPSGSFAASVIRVVVPAGHRGS